MTLYVGDRSPKAVRFVVSTGSVNGTTVASVALKVRAPNGEEAAITPSTVTSATSVALTWVLAGDGSSLPVAGTYWARAWLYDAGSALLLDTDEQSFQVQPARHTWPTT
jgi:hypothetical protein